MKIRATALAGCALLAASPAIAQESAEEDVTPNYSVSERFQHNFNVDGIRSGSFLLFPVVQYTQIYDDNIFTDSTDEVDDFIADMRAGLELRSDWALHDLRIAGGVNRLQYFENDSESTTNYNVRGDSVIDLGQRAKATLSGGYARQTEARRSLQTAIGDEPVQFSVLQAAFDVEFRQNRFAEQLGVTFSRQNFSDVIERFDINDLTPGEIIDQDFRDRDTYGAFYRQSFRLRPTVALFGEVRGEVQEYDIVQANTGTNQDSQTYAASAGIALDINKVARGEIGVGYQSRNYDSDLFDDISGLRVNAELDYFLSDLTTIFLSARRSIEDTAIIGLSGFSSSRGEVRIEHELLRRVLLVGGARYTIDDFRSVGGVDVDRTDKFLEFSAGAEYAFRRNIIVGAKYTRVSARSSGLDARPEFDENIALVSLEFRR